MCMVGPTGSLTSTYMILSKNKQMRNIDVGLSSDIYFLKKLDKMIVTIAFKILISIWLILPSFKVTVL